MMKSQATPHHQFASVKTLMVLVAASALTFFLLRQGMEVLWPTPPTEIIEIVQAVAPGMKVEEIERASIGHEKGWYIIGTDGSGRRRALVISDDGMVEPEFQCVLTRQAEGERCLARHSPELPAEIETDSARWLCRPACRPPRAGMLDFPAARRIRYDQKVTPQSPSNPPAADAWPAIAARS